MKKGENAPRRALRWLALCAGLWLVWTGWRVNSVVILLAGVVLVLAAFYREQRRPEV